MMKIDASWISLLDALDSQKHDLQVGLQKWILSKNSSSVYGSIKTPNRVIVEHGFIDWRTHFGVSGSIAINKTGAPFLPLLSYDHVFIGLSPCSLNAFNAFHSFDWEDMANLIEYARSKRVIFYLTDKAASYRNSIYLQELFEEFRPLHLPHTHVRLAKSGAFPHPFDAISESTTDQPNISKAIGKFAKRNSIALTPVDATLCYTLQEMHYAGHEELANACLELLRKDPDHAVEFVWLLRRIWLDPILAAPGIPHAFAADEFSATLSRTGLSFQSNGVAFPGDVGAIIADIASFPVPSNWAALSWCEEHLDLKAIRHAFEILNAEATKLADTDDFADALNDELRKAVEISTKSTNRTKHSVFWTTSMSIALLGTLFTGPVVGVLAALGMTAATNVWLDPLAEITSKALQPNSFHLWKMRESLGRRNRSEA